MIHYTLKCAEGHEFDSWFQSTSAFDKLLSSDMVACAVCGSTDVQKALMAPTVATRETAQRQASAPDRPLSGKRSPAEQALARLRAHVEANSEYVGTSFAREARAMHAGETDQRPIWGETRGDEARKLIEDGVPIAPLPFRPTRNSN